MTRCVSSQVVQLVLKSLWDGVEAVADKERQLVAVLDHGRDPAYETITWCLLQFDCLPDCARPVEIEVSQPVCEGLQMLGFQAARVLHHVVRGGVHRSLSHRLRDDEEIVSA